MGLQGEGLTRGMQCQCVSCMDGGSVSLMLQLGCERSLMPCQLVLGSGSSEVFPDLSDVVIPAGLSHADTIARASDGFRSWTTG